MSWSQKAGNWLYSSRCCLSMSWCLRAVFKIPLAACLRDSTLLLDTDASAQSAWTQRAPSHQHDCGWERPLQSSSRQTKCIIRSRFLITGLSTALSSKADANSEGACRPHAVLHVGMALNQQCCYLLGVGCSEAGEDVLGHVLGGLVGVADAARQLGQGHQPHVQRQVLHQALHHGLHIRLGRALLQASLSSRLGDAASDAKIGGHSEVGSINSPRRFCSQWHSPADQT